ncbi:hypothetical protein BN946_scf184980.g27 [Trametes cinnabarina]|uniref:Protein rds1 n=1 Tax=Pycnoporus cinnabarinus TaxID=5643 RepID=A0A060SE47_PYCCI|nr:hypothetical protein BN946_scf184980.g27 [Trametes cinnabarina]
MLRLALPLVLSAVVLAAPFTPSGGLGTNSTPPIYQPLSDFDFQSLSLALYQEYIELDLFHHGLAQFSTEDFDAAGLNAQDRYLIEFMADQEVGHASLLSNILGPDSAAKQCNYTYPFQTVHDMSWTLLAPYITSCPENNTHLVWQNFPALNITNNPNVTSLNPPAISSNTTYSISNPGRTLNLTWDSPGRAVGPNGAYNTSTSAGEPKFVAWISQLNTTFTELNITGNNSGSTVQPGGEIFGNGTFSTINGTMHVLFRSHVTFGLMIMFVQFRSCH